MTREALLAKLDASMVVSTAAALQRKARAELHALRSLEVALLLVQVQLGMAQPPLILLTLGAQQSGCTCRRLLMLRVRGALRAQHVWRRRCRYCALMVGAADD